jgi:hypothetical protein
LFIFSASKISTKISLISAKPQFFFFKAQNLIQFENIQYLNSRDLQA